MSDIENRRQKLMDKMWMLMIQIGFIFGVPAGIGFFVGKYIDSTYQVRPMGTVGVLGLTFVLSWVITIKLYSKMNRELRDLDEEKRKEQEASQKRLHDEIEKEINKEMK